MNPSGCSAGVAGVIACGRSVGMPVDVVKSPPVVREAEEGWTMIVPGRNDCELVMVPVAGILVYTAVCVVV